RLFGLTDRTDRTDPSRPPSVPAPHQPARLKSCSFSEYCLTLAEMNPTELFDLTGEVAVVIGATGALGGAIAGGLAQAGARVAVVGRNAERGAGRVNDIKQAGGQTAFFSADAMSQESLRAAHQQIEKSLGAPTILVNAAGGNDPKVSLGP